jgi:hypothetical protein
VSFALAGGFNVFFVWGVESGLDPLRISKEDGEDSLVLLPDDDCRDGMDLPHAAGRYLGSPAGGPTSGVMSACDSEAERRRVPKEVADAVNSS